MRITHRAAMVDSSAWSCLLWHDFCAVRKAIRNFVAPKPVESQKRVS